MTQRIPAWRVQAAYEPAGRGHDLAHTIGLSAHGRPELSMSGRPTDADDVDGDLRLEGRELTALLYEYAWEWLDGTLEVGDEREIPLDGGLATLVITVGDAVDGIAVQGLEAPPAQVVPLLWKLEREPVRVDAGLTPAARIAWRRRIACSRSSVAPAAGLPPIPDTCDLGPGQAYGPLTPWVLLLAHAAATASPAWIIGRTIETFEDKVPAARAEVAVLGRQAGRAEALTAALALADRVTAMVVHRRAFREDARTLAQATARPAKEVNALLERGVRGSVGDLLVSAVLEDVLPPELVTTLQLAWHELLVAKGALGRLTSSAST